MRREFGKRERVTAPVAVNCCRVAVTRWVGGRLERRFEFILGSGPGIRTLNLAVNRSLRHVQKWRSEFAECR
jgi:hypothetical protein